MLKKILIALAVVAVLIAVAVYYVVSNIDTIAENIIERSGTKVLGTDVSVESVNIDLGQERATIKGLVVANPAGYSEHPAFSFSEITAEIDIRTGVVRRLFTGRPEAWVEFKNGESNFDVLRRNIQASAEQGTTGEKGSEEQDKGKAVSVQIDKMVVEEAKATVKVEGQGEPFEVTIKRLEFENLKGSPEQIARVALGQFVAQVLAATGRKMLQKRAEDVILEQGGKLKEKLKGLLEGN